MPARTNTGSRIPPALRGRRFTRSGLRPSTTRRAIWRAKRPCAGARRRAALLQPKVRRRGRPPVALDFDAASVAMVVREAEGGDYEAIIALLDAARLPTRDLTAAAIEVFLVASDAHELLGAIALERYVDVGLVRSLVVKPGTRGAGVGTALVVAVEQRARDAGIAALVLLTETAMNFFGALGYAMRQP